MGRCIRTARAEEDLIEIWLYVAEDDPAAADKLLGHIEQAFGRLADYLGLGPAAPIWQPGCVIRGSPISDPLSGNPRGREIPGGVEIVRVLHGARNLPALM